MPEDKTVASTSRREISPQQLDKIRAYLNQSIEELQVVGAGVAIIQGDEVVFCEGVGKRDAMNGLPVTADTLFAIGSSSKAFTTMSVGMLADDGKLEWDGPVANYVPEFKLHDKYASDNATFRDLASHRVGLPRHEFVWYRAPLSREELIQRLPHLPLTKPFRTTFQYQNLMYVTLGYAAGKISESSWEQVVQERIFNQLGMKRSNFSVSVSQQDADYSKPYTVEAEEIEELPFANIDSIGPAGSINSSARDMAEWVKLHLGKGQVGEKRFISETNLKQMHTPHIPSASVLQDERVLFPSYGLGWFTEVYRGMHCVHHGGNIDGFTAMVAMLPSENLGVVILSNQDHSVFPDAAARTIFDIVLGFSDADWNKILKDYLDKALAAFLEGKTEDENVPDTKPSHGPAAYVGKYEHPAYGIVDIALADSATADGDNLTISYHVLPTSQELAHVHYDVFSFYFAVGSLKQHFKIQFLADVEGKIDRLLIRFEDALEPFVFVRKLEVQEESPDTLAKYTGEYDLAGSTAKVELRGDGVLVVSVPGQPTLEMAPLGDAKFGLKGLSGFEVHFVVDDNGECKEAKFKQPNGTFTLKRKD